MVWAKWLSRQEAGRQLGGQGESGHGLDSSNWTQAGGPPPLETPPWSRARAAPPAAQCACLNLPGREFPGGPERHTGHAHWSSSRDRVLSSPGVRPDCPALPWLLRVSAKCRPCRWRDTLALLVATGPNPDNHAHRPQTSSRPSPAHVAPLHGWALGLRGSSFEAGRSTLRKGRRRGQVPTWSRPTRAAEGRPVRGLQASQARGFYY